MHTGVRECWQPLDTIMEKDILQDLEVGIQVPQLFTFTYKSGAHRSTAVKD